MADNNPHLLSHSEEIDLSGFNPSEFLSHFDYGKVEELDNGRKLRKWEIVAVD